ncbi:MAG TPA: tetratricopeptide repeat protein, partial [Candidatus Obscuribacterales bacterium]|nr:tetratricopeptide repeat protein [Candidatus Obscuribacterales bacterium]
MSSKLALLIIVFVTISTVGAFAYAGVHSMTDAHEPQRSVEPNAIDAQDEEFILQAALLAARGDLKKQLPILRTLAEVYRSQNRLKEEESCLLKAIGIVHALEGSSSVSLGASYMRLSAIYFAMEDYIRAELAGKTAVDIFGKSCGMDSINLALAYNNLGWIEMKHKNYSAAESHISAALSILRKTIGRKHLLYGLVSENLGVLLLQKGEHANSLKAYKEALSVLSKKLPANDPVVIDLNNRCAEVRNLLNRKTADRHCE